ncbi:hypothetical protein [Streptococcus gallolyticus]|uniref:Uncharacterized protein n=1 Tax=Streptococcus gallolyticus TaxID=315405 RepID=A0A1H9VAS9_9STRE|nr:hypothetical protein [Streptococcus gallolyticus]SES18775.1 hypothetical protein SAMN04487840_12129 [Streptococcus gallolyticus]
MEFYKEYADTFEASAMQKLNLDIKNNPQWKSEVQGYTVTERKTPYTPDFSYVLVRWVGLSTTPFKGDKL